MPSKTVKTTRKGVSSASSVSEEFNGDFVAPHTRTPSSNRNGDRAATKASSSSPRKKPPPQRRPPPSPKTPASSSSDPDAYAADVLASSSSLDDDSDVFDPATASDPESETAQRRPSRRSNASGMSTASSVVEALESDLDEEDEDIGLNYHAKSVSPKKRPSSSRSPAKKRATAISGGKRKRDEYSDVAPSDSEDDSDSEVVKIQAPSKSSRRGKGAMPKTSAKNTLLTSQTAKKKKAERSDVDDSGEEGFTVVGRIVQAPTTNRVPPGQISQNTLDFLSKLVDPACNDREWFKLNEPVYRLAEKEWKAFMEILVPMACEVDEQLPPLPPNDVIHRIYRDIRFSNDKTPYKRNFSASMTRAGRKGKFAGYHISIRPGGSMLGAGLWQPERDALLSLRANILHDATPLREAISEPRFVELFGEAEPHPKGLRRNVFGQEDQLKVAPKGVAKDHPDIDLLRLRTVAVMHHFTDKEVLKPAFNNEIVRIMEIMRPLVHVLNDMITLTPGEGESDE